MDKFFNKHSKNIFEASFYNSNQAIYWINKDGAIVSSNECALKMLGYSKNELLKLNVWDLDFKVNTKEKYIEIVRNFTPSEIDDDQNIIFTEHLKKSGKKFPVEVVSKFAKIEEEEYLISYVRDISQRVQRDKDIKFYFSLLNSSNDMIFLVSKDTMKVEFANETACKSLGFTLKEFQQMNVTDFRSPFEGVNEKSIPEIFKEIETQNKLITFGNYLTKDGKKFPVETSLRHDTYDGKEFITAISRNISDRLELEIKKEELNKNLKNFTENLQTEVRKTKKELIEYENIMKRQSKMAAMGEMLENISHQWRQPLSAVSVLSTGMVLQKKENILNDELLEAGLVDINEHVQYLSKTIDDFRNFFKPNNKKNLFLIKDMVDMLIKLSTAKYDNFLTSFICNIENLKINTFENELLQVLLNIVSNARDAFLESKSKEKMYVFIDIYKKNNDLIIEIKDNAGGIPLSVIDRIFKPYFTTKAANFGTGIGLYMSNKIITQHLLGKINASNITYIYNKIEHKGALLKIKFPL